MHTDMYVCVCAYVETYSKHMSYAYYSGQAVMVLVGRFHNKFDLIVENITVYIMFIHIVVLNVIIEF